MTRLESGVPDYSLMTGDTHPNSSVLFVVQAAHYIGRGCNVVLCIQKVTYCSAVDSEMVILTVFISVSSPGDTISDVSKDCLQSTVLI